GLDRTSVGGRGLVAVSAQGEQRDALQVGHAQEEALELRLALVLGELEVVEDLETLVDVVRDQRLGGRGGARRRGDDGCEDKRKRDEDRAKDAHGAPVGERE